MNSVKNHDISSLKIVALTCNHTSNILNKPYLLLVTVTIFVLVLGHELFLHRFLFFHHDALGDVRLLAGSRLDGMTVQGLELFSEPVLRHLRPIYSRCQVENKNWPFEDLYIHQVVLAQLPVYRAHMVVQ